MNTVSRIFKNTGVIILGDVLLKIVNFFVIVYTARYLGDAGFGRYSFVFAYVGLFTILSSMSIDTILIREVSKDKSKAGKYIGNALAMKLFLSFIAILIVYTTISFLDYPQEVTNAVYLAAFSLLFTSLTSTYAVILHVNLQMVYSVLTRIAVRILAAILILTIIYTQGSFLSIIFVLIAVELLEVIILRHFSGMFVKPKLEFDWQFNLNNIIKPAIPLAFAGIFITIYLQLDVVMLSLMKSDAMVGYYSAAAKLTHSLRFIPGAVMVSMFPLMSEYFWKSREKLKRAYENSLRYLTMLIIPIAFGTTMLADKIILFFYGENFSPAVIALSILIWVEVFIYINQVVGQIYVASNRQTVMAILTVLIAIVNVSLNLLLIPPLGHVGTSISRVASEALAFVVGFIVISRLVIRVNILRIFIYPVVSSIIMVFFIDMIQDISLLVVVPSAAVVYFVFLTLLGGFRREDLGILSRIRVSGA